MPNKLIIYTIGNSFFSNKEEALALANRSSIGELKDNRVFYSIYEVLYLLEKSQATLMDSKENSISFHNLLKKNPKSHLAYFAFKDLRDKGLILKEGLKFGTDFRVYNKGDKPGKAHAKYLLHITDSRNKKIDLQDFCAKARIAHTTKKILLLAIVDSEKDINYYEVNWNSLL